MTVKNMEKHRREKTKNDFKPFSRAFLIIMVFTITLLSINLVTGWQFDNTKTYNPELKEVTIKNAFGLGGDVAKIKLNTPQHVVVFAGQNKKIAEFELTHIKNDNGGLNKLEFYNIKNSLNKIERNFNFKVKGSEEIIVNDYEDTCEYEWDTLPEGLNRNCVSKLIGTHKENKVVWKDYVFKDLIKNEKITIGIFTDVYEGDYIEWIPTFYGVEINEWASFAGATKYERFETSNDYCINQQHQALSQTFTIGNTSSNVDISADGISLKLFREGTIKSYTIKIQGTDETAGEGLEIPNSTVYYTGYFDASGITTDAGGAWYNITMTGSIDLKANGHYSVVIYTVGNEDTGNNLRWRMNSGNSYKGGRYSESTNNGTDAWTFGANTYDATFQIWGNNLNAPIVTLNSPIDTYNSTSPTITFNCTASDNSGIVNVSLLINNSIVETNSSGVNDTNYLFTYSLTRGAETYNWTCSATDNENHTTTATVRTLTYSNDLSITLNSPINTYNSTTSNIIFNGTVSDDIGVLNVSLYINGILNETNSSGVNNSNYIFTKNINDGNYNWTYESCDTNECSKATNRSLKIDTTPFIEFINPTTTNDTNLTVDYIYSTINLTEIYFDNLTFYLYNSTGLYKNITFTNTTRFYNFTNLDDETYYFNSTVWTTTNQDNNTETRTVYVDSNAPTITIVYPVNETIYLPEDYTNSTTINANLNFTATDSHLDTCWYYNSTDNITINCSHNATINVSWGEYTFIVYANDTFGHVGKKDVTATWNYNILENSRTFSPTIITGASTNFSINVSFNDSKFTNSIGYLIYNETSYTATRTGGSGDYIFRKELTIPKLSVETNITFYWNFTLNNGTNNYYTGHSNNQTVTMINIDNCTAYSNLLYNFTIVDERSQNSFNVTFYNQTVELNMQIFSTDGLTMIQNLSLSYNETNPFAVCLNTNLSDGESYLIDLQLQYDADTYASEFYNIQKATLTSSSLATNITLYDLDDDNAQEFKISFKDENLLPVENVLLQIQRKYINEGVFKIVEIPKTDSNGETIGHLELSDVIYNIIVTKDGIVLSTFNNIIAFCDNVATGDCTIDLSSALSHVQPTDYTFLEDFAFTKAWDLNSRIFNITYTIPSSTSRTVTLNGTLSDGLGTTNVCSSTLTSASGILVCNVPISFGNSSVIFKVYSDNIQKAEIFVSLWDDPSSIYGTSRIFLYMFLILTLVSVGLSSQPIVIGFFLFLGAVLSLVLNIIPNTGFWGAGATILWLLIAIVLVTIKGVNRN